MNRFFFYGITLIRIRSLFIWPVNWARDTTITFVLSTLAERHVFRVYCHNLLLFYKSLRTNCRRIFISILFRITRSQRTSFCWMEFRIFLFVFGKLTISFFDLISAAANVLWAGFVISNNCGTLNQSTKTFKNQLSDIPKKKMIDCLKRLKSKLKWNLTSHQTKKSNRT